MWWKSGTRTKWAGSLTPATGFPITRSFKTLSDVTDAPAGWILALRERYAPGTRAQVYFDPDHPERSYLLFRAVTGLWLLGLCSVTFVALAILLWRYGSR